MDGVRDRVERRREMQAICHVELGLYGRRGEALQGRHTRVLARSVPGFSRDVDAATARSATERHREACSRFARAQFLQSNVTASTATPASSGALRPTAALSPQNCGGKERGWTPYPRRTETSSGLRPPRGDGIPGAPSSSMIW